MKLKLIFFGITQDMAGEREIDITVQEGTSILELKKILFARYHRLKGLSSVLFAINESYEQDDYLLNEGDVVALIPPVSGG